MSARQVLSSSAFVLSAVLLGLLFMDRTYGIPFDMPRFWYVNEALWVGAALALIPLGWIIEKWPFEEPGQGWEPRRAGVRFRRVVIYTRRECRLCDEAKTLLAEYELYLPSLTEIDIGSDPDLLQRFSTTIPVIECDGKVRFRGRINELLLRRLIEGTPPIEAE